MILGRNPLFRCLTHMRRGHLSSLCINLCYTLIVLGSQCTLRTSRINLGSRCVSSRTFIGSTRTQPFFRDLFNIFLNKRFFEFGLNRGFLDGRGYVFKLQGKMHRIFRGRSNTLISALLLGLQVLRRVLQVVQHRLEGKVH